ncbi:DUF1269 domain-containing protein [Nakamurella lactea]|uniref:DUF1269 domain-containing protein n=1 Tax=Nakamurella lactea TaxID=459515 RepID=UPI00040DD1F6|nr:DUF1269 domain-containing protein [Nakamurella lactea]
MATLSVWKFETPEGAEQAEAAALDLQTRDLIRIQDAAVVSWEIGKKKPKTKQLNSLTGAGALGGTFWGMLFGLLFFIPLIGAAVGAAMGALTGAFTDVGIDDSFIKRVREKVVPGTSALFIMTTDAVVDKVAEAFRGVNAELIETNLSEAEEASLRAAFAEG